LIHPQEELLIVMDTEPEMTLGDSGGGTAVASPGPAPQPPPVNNSGYMTDEDQDNRRKRIKEIMKDPNLSQMEKSRAIQQLMDGRRRSSMSSSGSVASGTSRSSNHGASGGAVAAAFVGGSGSVASSSHHSNHNNNGVVCHASTYANRMAQAAAHAHDYYSSDEEGVGEVGRDAFMSDAEDEDSNSYGYNQLQNHNNSHHHYDSSGRHDEQSVASSVTHTSYQSNCDIPQSNRQNFPGGKSYRQIHGRSFSLQDWNDTDRIAAAANTSFMADPAQISKLMEQTRPNCEHYERNCTLIAPCCGLAFGCRICHDDCPALPKPLALRHHGGGDDTDMLVERLEDMKRAKMERRRSMPIDLEQEDANDENHHLIDRFAVREVICRSCYTRQSSKT